MPDTTVIFFTVSPNICKERVLGRTVAKWIIFWADNCPAQNYLMWFLTDLIRQVYSRIDFKFLIPGHYNGPTDRNFAVIEKYAAKVETVYTLQQWYEHVCNAVVSVGSIKIKNGGCKCNS